MLPILFVVAAAGTGVALAWGAWAYFAPAKALDISGAVARASSEATTRGTTIEQVASWADGHGYLGRYGPTLALLDMSPPQAIGQLIASAGILALIGAVVPIAIATLGFHAVAFATPLGAVVGAAFGAAVFFSSLSSKAAKRRAHLRQSFGSYIALVSLAVAGQMGLEAALRAAQRVSGDWVFVAIGDELDRASQQNRPGWTVFSALGNRYGERQIAGVASTLRQSIETGTGLRTVLEAKAASMREEKMSASEAAAGKATEKMFMPTSVMFIGYLIFLTYPALAHILHFL